MPIMMRQFQWVRMQLPHLMLQNVYITTWQNDYDSIHSFSDNVQILISFAALKNGMVILTVLFLPISDSTEDMARWDYGCLLGLWWTNQFCCLDVFFGKYLLFLQVTVFINFAFELCRPQNKCYTFVNTHMNIEMSKSLLCV